MTDDLRSGGQAAADAELRSRSFPIQEDMRLQRRTWLAERIGWALLGLLVGAAMLGTFGTGVLSTTTASGGQLEVAYQRFERIGAPTTIEVSVKPQPDGDAVLRVDGAFLKAFTIEALHPQPAEERPVEDGAEMVFRAPAGAPFSIYLSVKPERNGLVQSQFTLLDGPPATLTQFVFP